VVKVNRPINAVTQNISHIFGNGTSTDVTLGIRIDGVYTKIRITDTRSDLLTESSVWLFKSPLTGGGGMLCRSLCRPRSLF